jgi:hypothetical protein
MWCVHEGMEKRRGVERESKTEVGKDEMGRREE